MDKFELLSIMEEKAKREARENMLSFVQYVNADYIVNWHHRLVCYYLDKFASGELKRLMIFMPPQHGKSQLVSRSLPAFILGKNPNKKIVIASYSAELSNSFNRDCQKIIDTPEYHDLFPGTLLGGSGEELKGPNYVRNSSVFQILGHSGFLKTTGVGTSLTGTSADFAIIDDPVKDTMEAQSSTYQLRNWNWYNDVLYTRIHNESGILITQTRWDENDLSGQLLKNMEIGGEKWVVLTLPAIKETDDNPEDPRKIGEALWEDWHSLNKLQVVRNRSNRTFQSLYQQNPRPTETGGEAYKQFKVWRNTGTHNYDPALPLHISFDFNVNPGMHALVCQIKGKQVLGIKELMTRSPRNNTKGLCAEFKRIFQGHSSGLFVYGDRSGMTEDTRSEKGHNDYKIILSELSDYKPTLRVHKQNPYVAMRLNFINNIFETGFEGITISLDSRMTKTIEDLQFIKEDADGSKSKEKIKDIISGVTCEKWGHLSDALDYLITFAFINEYAIYQRGGKGAPIKLGVSTQKNRY